MVLDVKTVVLGQFVIDKVLFPKDRQIAPSNYRLNKNRIYLGGPPSFSGIAGIFLSEVFPWLSTPLIYSYICPTATSIVRDLKFRSEILSNLLEINSCPKFRLEYFTGKERKITMINPPKRFNPQDFPWKFSTPPISIVGSVFNEFNSPSIFQFLRENCSFIAFDAQGCFRTIGMGNEIKFRKWLDDNIISNINCLKVSEFESKYLHSGNTLVEIAHNLLDNNLSSILITRGNKGSILGYTKPNGIHKILSVPAFIEGEIVDETGAGDMFLFLYVSHLAIHHNEREAVSFASAATSQLLEYERFKWQIDPKEIEYRKTSILKKVIEF